eukprot:gene2608-2852_t
MEDTRSTDRFRFHIDDLIDFVFPVELQHPLAASRLIIFGLYGPLDEAKRLRSGRQGQHVLAEYELETMSIQIEREDILQVYLHRSRDMGLLNGAEQDMMISQADARLKQEKGKAMLPRISKEDVRQLLGHLPRDEDGRISFHEAQKAIDDFRRNRIQQFKLVYPKLTSSNSKKLTAEPVDATDKPMNSSSKGHGLGRTVSASVAPLTMFQKMRGLGPADLIEQTTKRLGKHGFKITSIDEPSNETMASNVRLLREIPPHFPEPVAAGGGDGRKTGWNETCALRGAGLGGLVKTTGGSTTWRRKYTSY